MTKALNRISCGQKLSHPRICWSSTPPATPVGTRQDGRGYTGQSAPPGRHGRNGQDATRAERGQDGGDIEVTLRPIGEDEHRVELMGRRTTPDQRVITIRELLTVGESGDVRLLAVGGQGGNGGRGGDGESGGKGLRGVDANRWSDGEDGQRGGDGGSGGVGTGGADGGRGGNIVVQTDQSDTHLLMLTRCFVHGGKGGSPGAHGLAGPGGPGGDGGDAYSWTTSSTEYVTDANGKSQPRRVTHRHRNRGGANGPPGRTGRSAQGQLLTGATGADGQVRIFVRDGQHTLEYLRRYEVEVTSYDVELTDRFAEPTSALRVDNITVQNTGGMPTPTRLPVEILLATSRWVTPRQHTLLVPRSLEPGESYRFSNEFLLADVPDIDSVPEGDPLRQTDRVAPLRGRRESSDFTKTVIHVTSFRSRFPVSWSRFSPSSRRPRARRRCSWSASRIKLEVTWDATRIPNASSASTSNCKTPTWPPT